MHSALEMILNFLLEYWSFFHDNLLSTEGFTVLSVNFWSLKDLISLFHPQS